MSSREGKATGTKMETLKPYREKIDALDDQILDLLARRTAVVRDVGALKAREGITLVQGARVEEVIARCTAIGQDHGINPELIRSIYTLIIDEAHRIEGEIIKAA